MAETNLNTLEVNHGGDCGHPLAQARDDTLDLGCFDLNQLWNMALPTAIEDEMPAFSVPEAPKAAEESETQLSTSHADDSAGVMEEAPTAEETFVTPANDGIDEPPENSSEFDENIEAQPMPPSRARPRGSSEDLMAEESLRDERFANEYITEIKEFEQSSEPKSSVQTSDVLKYLYSGCLLTFCIVIVAAAIFGKQTTATGDHNTHPMIAFAVFWFLILWLALMEGGLNCMVGLKPLDKDLYSKTHPLTYRCTSFAHRGNNLERFIVGRQFLDLSCVFLTSFMVSTIDGASVLGFPSIMNGIFLDAGVAVILVTIVIGQLISQINAAHCMLDFVNNYAMVATTYAALTIEYSGLLHAVYLVQIIVSKIAGRKIENAEGKRSMAAKGFFWARVAFSTALLLFALAACFSALYAGNTTMWPGVPPTISLILLVILILVAGNMEALQIAMIAVVHLPEGELSKHPVAHSNCQFTFKGSNLQAFLVGRQIVQTIIMFIVARITTLDISENDDNVFGVNDLLQNFFNTGVLGALITTIIASLSWRILASNFPLAFLSSPFAYVTIKVCLMVEHTGICSISWVLASLQKRLAHYKSDHHYVGTISDREAAAEEQAVKNLEAATTESDSS